MEKLIKEDINAGKLPLLLIANAGKGQPQFKHCTLYMSVLKELKMIHLMVKQQFRIQRILCILNMNFSDLIICF